MKPARANAFLFFPQFVAELHKALRENRTVLSFVYESRDSADDWSIHFDVRITKMRDLRLPATRSATERTEFHRRVVDLNARRFLDSQGASRPKRRPR